MSRIELMQQIIIFKYLCLEMFYSSIYNDCVSCVLDDIYISHSSVLIKHYSCPLIFLIHGRFILHWINVNIPFQLPFVHGGFMFMNLNDTTYPPVDIFTYVGFRGKNDFFLPDTVTLYFHKFHAMKQLIFYNHTWQNIYFIDLQIKKIKNNVLKKLSEKIVSE